MNDEISQPGRPAPNIYELYVGDIEPIRFPSNEDVKGIWWDAHKCRHRTFNVTDVNGTVYAMVTKSVIMVIVNPN